MHRAKFCHLYREVFLAGPDKPLNALIAKVGKCCRLTTFSKRCPSKLKCLCTVTYPQSDSGIQQSVAKFYELRREQQTRDGIRDPVPTKWQLYLNSRKLRSYVLCVANKITYMTFNISPKLGCLEEFLEIISYSFFLIQMQTKLSKIFQEIYIIKHNILCISNKKMTHCA